MKCFYTLLLFLCAFSQGTRAGTPPETGATGRSERRKYEWKAGFGRRIITPGTGVWLAGFGTKRAPEGKIHDIWVKVMALQEGNRKPVVLVTTDHQGMSKTIYERLYGKLHERFGIARENFMLTFSHNHSGPCLQDDLVDYYPSDAEQQALVLEYTLWMESRILEAVAEALGGMQPVRLYKGEGKATFAVNRRENKEAEVPDLLTKGVPLKGPVDHAVPVLAVRSRKGQLLGVLFGYACHPTTLSHNLWSGDYPGYAQANLEAGHPGLTAMFFNACGGDQNPLPRRTVALCEKYGKELSDAVEKQLAQPLAPLRTGLKTAFRYVDLPYETLATRETLLPVARGNSALHARWAKRMLAQLDACVKFPAAYTYPVQAWQMGPDLLLIGIGGEAVVDYSLRFKKEYGSGATWVSGYTNEMAAYIPSRRVWEEGGYEGGSHLDEYGRPAWRWAGDVEDRIASTVKELVNEIRTP